MFLSKRVKMALVVLLGMAPLFGCGQKGPLYLPEPQTGVEQEKAAPDADEFEAS